MKRRFPGACLIFVVGMFLSTTVVRDLALPVADAWWRMKSFSPPGPPGTDIFLPHLVLLLLFFGGIAVGIWKVRAWQASNNERKDSK